MNIPILKDVRAEIEILSTGGLFCWKFAAVCLQIASLVLCFFNVFMSLIFSILFSTYVSRQFCTSVDTFVVSAWCDFC